MATLPMPQSRFHLHYSQPTAICQDKTCLPCFPCKSCSSAGETCAHHNTPGWFPFIWNTNTENTRCRGWCMQGGKPQGDEGSYSQHSLYLIMVVPLKCHGVFFPLAVRGGLPRGSSAADMEGRIYRPQSLLQRNHGCCFVEPLHTSLPVWMNAHPKNQIKLSLVTRKDKIQQGFSNTIPSRWEVFVKMWHITRALAVPAEQKWPEIF